MFWTGNIYTMRTFSIDTEYTLIRRKIKKVKDNKVITHRNNEYRFAL